MDPLPVCDVCGAEIDGEVIVESDDEDAVFLCEDCLDE